ncbi:MAG: ribosome-associated translation inhibitor RaiA [Glaciecola sp.]|jgi:ribosome-associated translation inhibitor RaiA
MTTASVATTLQLGHGVHPSEFDRVVGLLGRLDERLRSFEADQVELHLAIKERDDVSQRIVLEARIDGWSTVVATSELTDVDAGIMEVRDELVRQITDTKNRMEPQHNRRHRTDT